MPEPINWYFSPLASIVLVYVLPLLVVGGSALRFVFRAVRGFQNARAARRLADDESKTLDEGDTILCGLAVVEDPQGAVRVTVEQEGSESESSGSWTTTWTEMQRRVFVAPFYVRHASGERVRVEPGKNTRLAAKLVTTERVDKKHRRRIAEIADDQRVWITGELVKDLDPSAAGGYRGTRSWVMRPGRGEMIVSTELPEAALRRRASLARVWAVVFSLLLAVMMLAHVRYHALVVSGRRATATVVDKRVISGDDSDTYELGFRVTHDVTTIEDTVAISASTYNRWDADMTFPAFASFGAFTCAQPGDGARALAVPTLITFVVWMFLAIASARVRVRLWHEGARVDESQAGRLEG